MAGQIRRLRPWLDVRVAFCERSEPNLRDVLTALDRRHWSSAVAGQRVSRAHRHPGMIDAAKVPVRQADTLGEDPRLVSVLDQRLANSVWTAIPTPACWWWPSARRTQANARTETLASALASTAGRGFGLPYATAEPSVARESLSCAAMVQTVLLWRRGSLRRAASPTGWRTPPPDWTS